LRIEAGTLHVVARTGGEEFTVLLGDPGHAAAAEVIERMRLAIEQARFGIGGVRALVTVSAGVAAYGTGDRTFEDMLRRADQALYSAKASGRNRVETALAAGQGIRADDGRTVARQQTENRLVRSNQKRP